MNAVVPADLLSLAYILDRLIPQRLIRHRFSDRRLFIFYIYIDEFDIVAKSMLTKLELFFVS